MTQNAFADCGLIGRAARLSVSEEIVGAGATEIIVIPMSFETGEQTTTKIYFNHKVTVNKIRSTVVKALSGTNNGTITASNSTGAMNNGVITHLASAALNDPQSVSPDTNNVIAKDDYIQLVSAKTTAGGKVLITLEVTRTAA